MIHSITVTGNIAVANGPSDSTLEAISARTIEKVVAKSITAEINAADTYANTHDGSSIPPPGHITLVKTTGGTGTGAAGDLTGNVRFRSLSKVNTGDESGIKIKGTISNNTRVSACITIDPSGTLDQPVLIDGTLSGNIYATGTTTAGVLPNQVIINRSNSSKTWSGNVILGSFTLSPSASQPLQAPYYNKTDSNLGGGAVGLVPFAIHESDSDATNLVVGQTVRLRFYGPVAKGSGSTPAIAVDYDNYCCTPTLWQRLPASDFTVTFSSNGRDVLITPNTLLDWDGDVRYKITPTNLVCDPNYVPGPVSVQSFEHILYP